MTSLYTPRNRCQCVSADEPFHLVVDCGFGLFMLLFVALLSRILTLVENPGRLWLEGVLLLLVVRLLALIDLCFDVAWFTSGFVDGGGLLAKQEVFQSNPAIAFDCW